MRSHIVKTYLNILYAITYNLVYLSKIDAIAYNEDFSQICEG
jgi:hypothetical protein